MDANNGALVESVVFLDHFKALRDPRQLIKLVYPRIRVRGKTQKRRSPH